MTRWRTLLVIALLSYLVFWLTNAGLSRHPGPVFPAFFRFILVIVVAYIANLATVLYLVLGLDVNGYFAQALGIIPYTSLSFIGLRLFAFPNES